MQRFITAVTMPAAASGALIAAEPVQSTPTHADISYGPQAKIVLDFW